MDFSDDVKSSLAILHYLDRDITEHSAHWFARNMLNLTEDGVEELINSRPGKKSHLQKEWLRAYYIYMKMDARGPQEKLTDNLNDGLDGEYWEKCNVQNSFEPGIHFSSCFHFDTYMLYYSIYWVIAIIRRF